MAKRGRPSKAEVAAREAAARQAALVKANPLLAQAAALASSAPSAAPAPAPTREEGTATELAGGAERLFWHYVDWVRARAPAVTVAPPPVLIDRRPPEPPPQEPELEPVLECEKNDPRKMHGQTLRDFANARGMAYSEMDGRDDEWIRQQVLMIVNRQYDTIDFEGNWARHAHPDYMEA